MPTTTISLEGLTYELLKDSFRRRFPGWHASRGCNRTCNHGSYRPPGSPPGVGRNVFRSDALSLHLMSSMAGLGAVGSRPNELTLYRCLVCGFQTLKADDLGEHLMSHAEAAKYAFASVVKD